MTRETKVGLMMVALLVGVFGFLIYQRIHRPSEGLAEQESPEILTRRSQDEVPQRNDNNFATFDRSDRSKRDRISAPGQLPDEDFATPASEAKERFSERTSNRWKSKSTAVATTDDDGFEQFEKKPAPKKSLPRLRSVEPANNSFDEFVAEKRTEREIVQVAAATESDSFANDANDASETEEPKSQEPDRSQATLAMPTDIDDVPFPEANPSGFDEAPAERVTAAKEPRRMDETPGSDNGVSRQGQDSRNNRSSRPSRVQQTGEFENGLEVAPREERRAAPVTFGERGFSPESPRTVGSVSGPSYVIEPNDNFWTISRKRYGAGRYYMALAKHNQQVISDPKRMKPGVAIATPDASFLEQHYADLIPKPAPAEQATPVVATQTRKSEDSGPVGFFVSNDGNPMYRVSSQDTLSDIARSHLGRSSRWVQILEMNRKVLRDGNELKIGTVLRLPPDASRVQVVGAAREFR